MLVSVPSLSISVSCIELLKTSITYISDKFHPMDILMIAGKLSFINQKDVDKLGNAEEAYDSTLVKNLMENIGAEQQAKILNQLVRTMKGQINFHKYTKTKGKKLHIFTTDDEPLDLEGNALHSKHILLHDNGNASELVSKDELVHFTIMQLKHQIAYSNEDEPPSVNINNDREPKIYMPDFMKEYIDHRLPVFVENALQAITMKKDREYMIYEDRDRLREGSSPNAKSHHFHRIIPVDFKVCVVLKLDCSTPYWEIMLLYNW